MAGIDNKVRQTVNGASYYFLTDQLGSISVLTDGTGIIVEQQQYDSFGNSTGSTLTRYDYTGRERDPHTGLIFYRARWYDPRAGRFISEDPISFGGGDVNLYGYVKNQPLLFRDPSGLRPCNPVVGALIGGGVGGVVGFFAGGFIGPWIGGGIGAVTGGTVGTAALPGGGTIAVGALGGGGGAGMGLLLGPPIGGVIGAGIGGYIGYRICSGGDKTCENSDAEPIPIPAPAPTPSADDSCFKKYYAETAWCGSVYADDYVYEQCMANAWANLWRCKNGLPPKPFPPTK